MRIVLDIEANRLEDPDKLWLIVCKDIDTGEYHVFKPETVEADRERALAFLGRCSLIIGHHILGFDYPVLHKLLGYTAPVERFLDTLILSKLIDYPRSGHSVADYGEEFGIEKITFNDFSKYSPDMETYCIRDVDITHRIYSKYRQYINKPEHRNSIELEHRFQLVCNDLNSNGFAFNTAKAKQLLEKVTGELEVLDKDILDAFPPREFLIREFTPKATKFGTISKTSVPRTLWSEIHNYEVGKVYRHTRLATFNPSSHKQIIQVLNEAGWRPIDKTKTHIDTEREFNKLKGKKRTSELDLVHKTLYDKLQSLSKTGWKVNEANLDTLPSGAPLGARLLAKRILLEARRRTLTEWIELTWHEIELKQELITELGTNEKQKTLSGWPRNEVNVENINLITQIKSEKITNETISNTHTVLPSKTLQEWLKHNKVSVQSVKEQPNSMLITVIGSEQLENFFARLATATSAGTKNSHPKCRIISQRIHGRFNGIGAWSHRMNHQNPNTANIPNEFDTAGKKKPYGKELRALWMAPKNRLLVGVDAEGIQLRIFAHYIDDPEFTQSLIEGKKDDKTDPHSLNQRILGPVCRSRAAAKRFIYALLLGAGLGKLSEILGATSSETEQALDRLMARYTGWALLKENVFPKDARRGWLVGLDGRRVRIPGDTEGSRRHLAMSGYLQNGEAVVMKNATLKWWQKLGDYDARLVNFVHDEWQTECPNNMEVALAIARMQADSLRLVGEELGLKCPLAGSYWNDDAKDYTIDVNWSKTH